MHENEEKAIFFNVKSQFDQLFLVGCVKFVLNIMR